MFDPTKALPVDSAALASARFDFGTRIRRLRPALCGHLTGGVAGGRATLAAWGTLPTAAASRSVVMRSTQLPLQRCSRSTFFRSIAEPLPGADRHRR